MRKSIFQMGAAALVLFLAASAFAGEDRVSTVIFLRNDLSLQEGNHQKRAFYAHWSYQALGAELEVRTVPHADYLYLKSSLTVRTGPVYLVGGLSTDSTGAEYGNAGVWYRDAFGKLSVFFDGRAYFGINGTEPRYFDGFLTVKRKKLAGTKLFAGLDVVYDHWWNESRNWYLVGPLVGYEMTKITSLSVRYSRAWNEVKKDYTKADQLRVELGLRF